MDAMAATLKLYRAVASRMPTTVKKPISGEVVTASAHSDRNAA